ncbi:glycosyltransferase family 2 protein [Peribacillus simplex]|uniref:glycosyltransferase family 2 protein n=1 Tax=Peribacillus simplex TaxID=1478 RepID=UPI0028532E2A|nr:glycosyltransferase family 2 protein [Peribacillus simplex]MDR4926183.1 glycosyltransferase family 2 protein [Peribacillus simplex]
MLLTSIVILTFNNFLKTKTCIESINKYTNQTFELIVVDNGSTDETVNYLKQLPEITLICNKQNRGFAAGCNQGISVAKGTQILLLNNDTIVSHNWLENLSKALHSNSKVGLVGPMSNMTLPQQHYRANYSNEKSYHQFASNFNVHDPKKWKSVAIISGFCLMFKRKVLKKIGLLDERFTIGNYEDVDYCYRALHSGFTLLVAGDTFVHHYGNTTFSNNNLDIVSISNENKIRFIKKWGIDNPEELLNITFPIKEI